MIPAYKYFAKLSAASVRLFLLCCCLLPLFVDAQAKRKKLYEVSGKLLITSEYCGGARPTEEMEAEFARPKPYQGKTLYVRKGRDNDPRKKTVLKVTSNENGEFNFWLAPGKYILIQEEQVNCLDTAMFKGEYLSADPACLKAWWQKPLAILEVRKNKIEGLEFFFHRACFVSTDIPCVRYNGPTPP